MPTNSLTKRSQQTLSRFMEAKQSVTLIDAEPAQISNVIHKGMILLGVKGEKLPSAFEITYMVQMLRQEYTNLPIGELNLAFELMATNKLDENPETYQNFSVLYLSRLMGSYARWAITQQPKKVEVQQEVPEVPEGDIVKMSYEAYTKNRSWEHIFMGLRVFKILHKRGLVGKDIEETVKLTEEAIKSQMPYVSHEQRKEIKKNLQDEEYMELACRRMAVAKYFENDYNK
jgi:hypothetical protein